MIQEFRRARRRKASDVILVTDAMTERVVGRVGNLSETGMLLIASEPLVDDALYQFRFTLPGGEDSERQTVDVGAHLLWQDHASAPGRACTPATSPRASCGCGTPNPPCSSAPRAG